MRGLLADRGLTADDVASHLGDPKPKTPENRESQVSDLTVLGIWWAYLDSNQGPLSYQLNALTA